MKKSLKRSALLFVVLAVVTAFLLHAYKNYKKLLRAFDDEPIGI